MLRARVMFCIPYHIHPAAEVLNIKSYNMLNEIYVETTFKQNFFAPSLFEQ